MDSPQLCVSHKISASADHHHRHHQAATYCTDFSLDELCSQLPQLHLSGSISEPDSTRKKKYRCSLCDKKFTGLPEFTCRCGWTYCINHRLPEDHFCAFDFKKMGRLALEKENPRCIADKLKNRI